jgi:hypothetical protein
MCGIKAAIKGPPEPGRPYVGTCDNCNKWRPLHTVEVSGMEGDFCWECRGAEPPEPCGECRGTAQTYTTDGKREIDCPECRGTGYNLEDAT